MDKLSGQRGLLLTHLEHSRRIQLLQGRQVPTHHALPIQRGADGQRRQVLLYCGARRQGARGRRQGAGGMEPWLEALQDSTRLLRVPTRNELHSHHGTQERRGGERALLRTVEDLGRSTEADAQEPRHGEEGAEALLPAGVVPVERGYGHGELPAQLLYGRGGD